MKKVLIIGFLHPFAQDGGSWRPLTLAQLLPEFGWEPIVLTPPLKGGAGLPFDVIETPYNNLNPASLLGKLRSFVPGFVRSCGGAIINYPDSYKGWGSVALQEGRGLLQMGGIDATVSCHPVTSHLVARQLKEEFGVYWIADFADLWSLNHNYGYGVIRQAFDKRLEKKTLTSADALVTITEPWADKLRALHRGKVVYAIPHGYDSAETNKPPARLENKFVITYTGNIYRRQQDPARLLSALKQLLRSGGYEDIEVRFYGRSDNRLEEGIKRYGLGGVVKQYGVIPREAVLQRQRESQVLLLLKWADPKEKGSLGRKVFEYLNARRPILAIGGKDDEVGNLLATTRAGVSVESAQEIESVLYDLYCEYKVGGAVAYRGLDYETAKYTLQEMVRKFVEVLEYARGLV